MINSRGTLKNNYVSDEKKKEKQVNYNEILYCKLNYN